MGELCKAVAGNADEMEGKYDHTHRNIMGRAILSGGWGFLVLRFDAPCFVLVSIIIIIIFIGLLLLLPLQLRFNSKSMVHVISKHHDYFANRWHIISKK